MVITSYKTKISQRREKGTIKNIYKPSWNKECKAEPSSRIKNREANLKKHTLKRVNQNWIKQAKSGSLKGDII